MAEGRLTKKEQVAMWRGRIRYAEERSEEFFCGKPGEGSLPGVDFAIDVFRGKSKPKWWCEEDPWVHVGKLKAAVRAALPSLMYANPRFRVFPAAKDIENGADVAYQRAQAKELWLNHVWREAEGMTHARIGIQNAFFSLGAIKAGYLCDFQDDEDRGVFKRTEDGEYVIGPDGDPELERGKYLTDEDGEKIRDEYGIPVLHPGRVTKEKWFVEVIDPKMLLFDVESGPDYFQHRFVIEKWVRPLEEVKRDPRFSPKVRKNLKATESLRTEQGKNKSIYDDNTTMAPERVALERDEARVCGYDVYDFQNQRYMVLAESGTDEEDAFLLDSDMPPGMEHGPFRFLKYTEDVGAEWYPIPDAIDMALMNQEYNITRSQMMIHREHTKTRYLEMPGAFDTDSTVADEERAKWAHAPDGATIKVSGPNVLMPAPKAQIDGTFMSAVPNIAADFNEVGGMPGEVRGVADAESATQASILASGAEIRNSDRRDNQVQKWLCDIARMLLMSGQANAELDSIVMDKVEDATGVKPFRAVKLTPEELQGEFEVTVEIGSTNQRNDPRALAQLGTLLANLGQNPWLGKVKGLMRRYLDGLNLDPQLADEIYEAASEAAQMQSGVQQGPPMAQGQNIGDMLGGIANAAGGAPTGAPVN
jgi:hypothetical protein